MEVHGFLAKTSPSKQWIEVQFSLVQKLAKNGLNGVAMLPLRPLTPVPWCERKRETLENAGHVSPRIWEMTKYNKERGAANSYHYSWLASSSLLVIFCHLPESARHVTSVFQGLSLPLSLSRSRGREGEDPGNEVESWNGWHVCQGSLSNCSVKT